MNGAIIKSIILFTLVFIPYQTFSFDCKPSDPLASITASKKAIRKDRWNAEAYACLALSYELIGDTYLALKILRDAEDQLPQHVLKVIHDYLWELNPELLATKEFKDRFTMSGGDCIIKNVSMIDGFGYLIIGQFYNPDLKLTTRHLSALKCSERLDNCHERNLICPKCKIVTPEVLLEVRQYRITATYYISEVVLDKNLRYVNRVLELQRQHYAR